jgi:four helix bundle protein
MQDYRKLRVWQRSHQLALATYAITARFTGPRTWPLRDQLQGAAISVPANIAEGSGRGSDPDFKRFLFHSLGSLNELEYDLFLALELGFLPRSEHTRVSAEIREVRSMLCGLIKTLKT